MNWGKIVLYSIALFVAGFAIGLFEGPFEPSGARLLGSAAASFVVYGAIFAHLAARQPSMPFVHAWAALLLQVAVGSVLAQALSGRPGNTHYLLVALEWFVVVCALATGTVLGINMRHRMRQPADA